MKVKSEREVAQLCPTPSDPMDYSLPGFSIDGIFQARILEWVAMPFWSGLPGDGDVSVPSCCAFIHRVAFKEMSGRQVLI